jgi:hypothetical protein
LLQQKNSIKVRLSIFENDLLIPSVVYCQLTKIVVKVVSNRFSIIRRYLQVLNHPEFLLQGR